MDLFSEATHIEKNTEWNSMRMVIIPNIIKNQTFQTSPYETSFVLIIHCSENAEWQKNFCLYLGQ